MHGPIPHALYLLFTPSLCPGDPWAHLEAALDGGVDLVQWRVKHADAEGARRCLEVCSARNVPLIVNDDVELAAELGAAGAHVGQDDLDARSARRRLGDGRWLGVSTHATDQVIRAFEDGADHVGFGPIHPTTTKGEIRRVSVPPMKSAVPHRALDSSASSTGMPVTVAPASPSPADSMGSRHA